MKRLILAAVVLLCLLISAQVFAQDASLSGTVTDASGAVIPGVAITATNDNTGVVSNTVSNTAGAYSYPRLLPGVYTVKADMKGFQPKTYTKVTLGASQQARLNFQLEVGGVATTTEVSTSAEQLILESSSSVGDVLTEKKVEELPLVNRNALDLVKIMSGVVMADDTIFNANSSTFAGVGANGVNIQRDGVTVNDVRWPAGINAATRVNPDLVGEFRMILAPVDAEVGRGNAQIQISTKAGTNEYHGGLVWNVQNTALDPNTWENNRNGSEPPWRNLHQWTASAGGPIIKNKTFFFVLYDGQLNKIRTPFNVQSLTPCAQRGIFRFFDSWSNGNALQQNLPTAAYPITNSVDTSGNPRTDLGPMRYASVFGTITNLASLPAHPGPSYDCSDVQVNGLPVDQVLTSGSSAPWDPLRPKQDPSGYISDFLTRLPAVNNYLIGDGLNTAGHMWSRTLYGADNLFGVGEDTYRRQINARIDHNFNDVHRIHGSWSWEKDWADDNFKNWPDGYGGQTIRRPMVLTVNLISSLKPTLLNELKFGMSRTGTNVFSPYTNPGTGQDLQKLLADHGGKLADGEVAVIGPGLGAFAFTPESGTGWSNYYGGRGILSYSGTDNSPRYSWGDTLSWTKSTHSLRFGGEIRYATSRADNQWTGPFFAGYNSYPYAQGGESVATPTTFTNVTGTLTGNAFTASDGMMRAMRDLLVFQSGSLAQFRQWRYINQGDATSWNDPISDPALTRDTVQKEFSLFFKDDWKIRPDLTLNLGVRYDYYGVPFLKNGLTTGLEGGGGAIFGSSGGFDNWFAPISPGSVAPGNLVKLRLVGPDSPNPGDMLYPRDWNNIGPAVGFSYQLPWFGKGKTTIRGGYQISYIGNNGRASAIQTAAGQAPGTTYSNNYVPTITGSYLGIKDIAGLNGLAVPSAVEPGITVFTAYDRQSTIEVFAPNYVAPYVQNITFAVTRNVTSNLMVDLRYVGTLTRKNFSTLQLNSPNFLTNGLLEAFNQARAGGNPALLDQLFNGMTLPTFGPNCVVDGVTCHGGDALRAANGFAFSGIPTFGAGWFTPWNQMLARGQYGNLANAINALAKPGEGYGQYIEENGFPIDFIKASPQFDGALLDSNQGVSNYHSFQAQITLRPTHGINFQSTYTWSKNLGWGNGFNDPRDLHENYTLLSGDRRHNWVTYGTFELPFGPGRLIGNSSSGAVARILGGWSMSWISTVQSGAPLTVGAQSGLYGVGTPDVVGNFDYNSVGVYWPDGAAEGNFFGGHYDYTADPQCANVAPGLQSLCDGGLRAIMDTNTGQIVLQNPLPGSRGNMGQNTLVNPMRWNVDASMSKSFAIDETRSFRIRVDFTNLFNHVQPSGTLGASGTRIVFPTAPNVSVNSTTLHFGAFPYKVGGRTFQFMGRFDF
jgi:hypothetical protein